VLDHEQRPNLGAALGFKICAAFPGVSERKMTEIDEVFHRAPGRLAQAADAR